jgi:hypothetical protein
LYIVEEKVGQLMVAVVMAGAFAVASLQPVSAADKTCSSNPNGHTTTCTHQQSHGSPKDTMPFILPFP